MAEDPDRSTVGLIPDRDPTQRYEEVWYDSYVHDDAVSAGVPVRASLTLGRVLVPLWACAVSLALAEDEEIKRALSALRAGPAETRSAVEALYDAWHSVDDSPIREYLASVGAIGN